MTSETEDINQKGVPDFLLVVNTQLGHNINRWEVLGFFQLGTWQPEVEISFFDHSRSRDRSDNHAESIFLYRVFYKKLRSKF
jgi:hypothetical protein